MADETKKKASLSSGYDLETAAADFSRQQAAWVEAEDGRMVDPRGNAILDSARSVIDRPAKFVGSPGDPFGNGAAIDARGFGRGVPEVKPIRVDGVLRDPRTMLPWGGVLGQKSMQTSQDEPIVSPGD